MWCVKVLGPTAKQILKGKGLGALLIGLSTCLVAAEGNARDGKSSTNQRDSEGRAWMTGARSED